MSATPRKPLAAVPNQGEATSRTDTPASADQASTHGPYSRPPRGPALLSGERQAMLAEVLAGVRLHAFDRKALDWLCRWTDTPTFLAVLGVLERARQLPGTAERTHAATGKRDRG